MISIYKQQRLAEAFIKVPIFFKHPVKEFIVFDKIM